MGYPLLRSGKKALSSETFAIFETTKSFSGARNISVHAMGGSPGDVSENL